MKHTFHLVTYQMKRLHVQGSDQPIRYLQGTVEQEILVQFNFLDFGFWPFLGQVNFVGSSINLV